MILRNRVILLNLSKFFRFWLFGEVLIVSLVEVYFLV